MCRVKNLQIIKIHLILFISVMVRFIATGCGNGAEMLNVLNETAMFLLPQPFSIAEN